MIVHYPAASGASRPSSRIRFPVAGILLLVGLHHPSLWVTDAVARQHDHAVVPAVFNERGNGGLPLFKLVDAAPIAAEAESSRPFSPASIFPARAVAWSLPRAPSKPGFTESPGWLQGTQASPAQDTAVVKKNSKLKWILIAAAGAAAGGVFAFKSGSSSSGSSGGNLPAAGPIVTVGNPSVGTPQ